MVNEWEPWLERYIPAKGKHALDIGANLGQWAAFLSKRFDQVTSFEPNPELADRVRKLKLPNVELRQEALWVACGTVDFDAYGDSPHGYGVHSAIAVRNPHAPEGKKATIQVKAVTLDSLDLGDVDFLKLDVEGAEVNALMGACRTIEHWHPAMIVECHEPEHSAWIRTWLDRIGYNVAVIHGPGYEPGTAAWRTHHWLVAEFYK